MKVLKKSVYTVVFIFIAIFSLGLLSSDPSRNPNRKDIDF